MHPVAQRIRAITGNPFITAPYPVDLQGWNGTHPIFARLIRQLRPKLAIEVGTWKGQSALTMAYQLHAVGGHLICIDTWLGGLEAWTDPAIIPSMGWLCGTPSTFSIFRSNVVIHGMEEVITPLPATSRVGLTLLREWGAQPELIYLDGSHETYDVVTDIDLSLKILRPGGVILGDDWTWPSVRQAVQLSANAVPGLTLAVEDEKWTLTLPSP